MKRVIEDNIAVLSKDPHNKLAPVLLSAAKYAYSIHFLEENCLQNAKRLGYLDVRELYQDIAPYTLEEFAEYFYGLEDPGNLFAHWEN